MLSSRSQGHRGTAGRALLIPLLLGLALPTPVEAIPAFARKYGVSCSLCHSPFPRLNAFGESFAANGFEFSPTEQPRDTINTGDRLLRLQRNLPLAVRFDAYLQALGRKYNGQTVTNDLMTPWTIKLLSGGQVADKISYYMYFFFSERGEVAGLEDAYLQFTDIAGSGVSVIAGQFQLSDPLFKRELRLQYEDYQPYRVRVGEVKADLTYDRGLMALYSPWKGGDLSFQVVNGQGLRAAGSTRQYDADDPKNVMLRYSQDVGRLRVGGFVYRGIEKSEGRRDDLVMFGPDATLPLGSAGEINVQYFRRTDDNPFFEACSASAPCAGGRLSPLETTVDAAMAEIILWPRTPNGRVFLTGLYNYVSSSDPVISLRLGEQSTPLGYLRRFHTGAVGATYLWRRNVRVMGELGWDFESDRPRVTTGVVTGF